MEELKRRSYSSGRQNYGRSRYTASKTPPQSDIRETILTQCIICGVILIFTLVISLVDSSITNNIRNTIKTALSVESGIDSLSTGFNELSQSYSGIKNSLNTIFGKTPDIESLPNENGLEITSDTLNENMLNISANPNTDTKKTIGESVTDVETFNQEIPEQEVFNQTIEPKNENKASIYDENFRIDEDILAQIDSVVDFYNKTNQTFIKN